MSVVSVGQEPDLNVGKPFHCSPQHQADAVTKKFDPETNRFWSAGIL